MRVTWKLKTGLKYSKYILRGMSGVMFQVNVKQGY